MAMSKAASDRIMAKLGPLVGPELETYNLLMKNPDEYVPPDPESGVRTCGICGAKLQGVAETSEERAQSALEQFTKHQAEHNSSPAQWTEAHRRIQSAKEQAKAKEKASLSV